MLYDSIENFIKYVPDLVPKCKDLIPLLKQVQVHTFEDIKKMDFAPLELRFGEYNTKPPEEVPFEAHKKYWDLQIVMEGEEFIGYAPLKSLVETVPYNEPEDIAFYSGKGQMICLRSGMAVLLAPWDGHRPGINIYNSISNIKKIVVKLKWQQ